MEIIIAIAAIASLLLLFELLLPTGGVLAILGAIALVVAGVISFSEEGSFADFAGAGLITFGVLSIITFFVITPKILSAHRDEPVRTGWEELVGMSGEVREPLNPQGQIWVDGALWKAKVADGAPEAAIGNRVRVESVDGLTLVVAAAEDN